MLRRLLGLSLLIVTIACGGTGGGAGSTSGGVCSSTSYIPNYATASGMTLRRWDHLPIKVFFETSTPVGTTTIEEHLKDGFDQWEASAGQNLWTEVSSAGAADLTVKVQASAPQSTLATTTVYFNTGTSILSSAEMVVYTWASIPEGDYAPTGCHEMGHALGIGGHSGSSLDMMYYTGNISGLLTIPDLNTLRTCYCDFTTSGLTAPTRSKGGPVSSETYVCGPEDLKK